MNPINYNTTYTNAYDLGDPCAKGYFYVIRNAPRVLHACRPRARPACQVAGALGWGTLGGQAGDGLVVVHTSTHRLPLPAGGCRGPT